MHVVLIMFRNGGERRSFSVVRSTTTIGRREDCDLRIPVGDVSRKHCRLLLGPDNLRIQDLGSSNGTYVNGQPVQESFLNPGDSVSVGPVNFVVQIDGVPDEADLAPPAAHSAAGETGAGHTALAMASLGSADAGAEPDLEDAGQLEEVGALQEDDLLAPPADDLSTEDVSAAHVPPPVPPLPELPARATDMTIDELPTTESAAAAFDLVELDEPGADASALPTDDAAGDGKPVGEWDFLDDDAAADAGHGDVALDAVDLDTPKH